MQGRWPCMHNSLTQPVRKRWSQIMMKAAGEEGITERARRNWLAAALVAFSQGIAFFHAGDDILRSKSLDRDSYNSGAAHPRLHTHRSGRLGHAIVSCSDLVLEGELADVAPTGDWFNKLDFSYQSNNFGVGLPPAAKNEAAWPLKAPLLGDPAMHPSPELIQALLPPALFAGNSTQVMCCATMPPVLGR